ncbi:MAG: hypothetical protein AAF318_06935 [Pseudomonadota bacterium]
MCFAPFAAAEPAAVRQCLSCHVDGAGTLDIVGVSALSALPEEWQFLFEDAFDLDGDGVAGRMRFVSGKGRPLAAKYGKSLAAARFEDFALIAAAVHDIDLSAPGVMDALSAAFEARSPAPTDPLADAAVRAQFEARGCARCHVTRTFTHAGVTYRPLSDFLLHEMAGGPRRTAPLWGCPSCVTAPAHAAPGALPPDN